MRYVWIACGVLAFGLAVGCKKSGSDTAGTTGTTGTTASPGTTGKDPSMPPDVKETGGESGGTTITAESVAGTYEGTVDEALRAQLEKAGNAFGGGTMTLNGDGTFEAEAKVGAVERKTKGTFKIVGNTITTTITEVDGKPAENVTPQTYTVSADGKELGIAGVEGLKYVKK